MLPGATGQQKRLFLTRNWLTFRVFIFIFIFKLQYPNRVLGFLLKELLALEERMGTVSTALPEEALSKCLKRCCYMPTALFPGLAGCGEDDTKCSICQVFLIPGYSSSRKFLYCFTTF